MKKELSLLLELSRETRRISSHFDIVDQSILLKAIQNFEEWRIENVIKRPLSFYEKKMIEEFRLLDKYVKEKLFNIPPTKNEVIIDSSVEIFSFEIIKIFNSIQLPISITATVSLLRDGAYHLIEEKIKRNLTLVELELLHRMRKMLPEQSEMS